MFTRYGRVKYHLPCDICHGNCGVITNHLYHFSLILLGIVVGYMPKHNKDQLGILITVITCCLSIMMFKDAVIQEYTLHITIHHLIKALCQATTLLSYLASWDLFSGGPTNKTLATVSLKLHTVPLTTSLAYVLTSA